MGLKAGDTIKTNTGNLYFILKVGGKGYTQKIHVMSEQSRNEPKTNIIYTTWDGKFLDYKSQETIDLITKEINPTSIDLHLVNSQI